ncbi:hypothetical protein BH23GEM9_BH23GEM9_17910 [soil metagenome]
MRASGRIGRASLWLGAVGLLGAEPAAAQRLLDEWKVRPTAGAEALSRGSTAVFWNPAQITVARRGEASVMDLRAPGVTGVDGLAAAFALALDERTVLGIGYEYISVGGVEQTTTSPDGGAPIDLAENRLGLAASHRMGERLQVGALVQYTRLPEISPEASVIALGAGLSYRIGTRFPVEVAAMGGTEGESAYWLAGVELASGERWTEWQLRGEYGAAGSRIAPGTTHRAAAAMEWRRHVELMLGAASEPDGTSRSLEPLIGAEVRLQRYRLGMVREQLPNDFGGAWSFRFSIEF